MEEHVIFAGRPSCLVFATKDHKGQPSQEFRTLLIQELLRRRNPRTIARHLRGTHRRRHQSDRRRGRRSTRGVRQGNRGGKH